MTVPNGLAALLCGDTAFLLPMGTARIATPLLRPLPGAPPGLLGLAMLAGQVVPAYAPGGRAGPVWLACPGLLLTGDAVLEVAPASAQVFQPNTSPAATVAAAPPAPARPLPTPPSAPPLALMELHLGRSRLQIPMTLLLRVMPLPPMTPPPGRPFGALGLTLAETLGPVLLLDPAWFDAAWLSPQFSDPAPNAAQPGPGPLAYALTWPLMAVLVLEGRLWALPCLSVTPASTAPALSASDVRARLAHPASAPLWALAPLIRSALPAAAIPSRSLLLAEAGGIVFALPVEEVTAVVPPQALAPLAGGALRGLAAHRGVVLPVLDAGEILGGRPVLAGKPQPPLLRLAGPRPVALAVDAVLGLRHLPETAIRPVPGEGLLAALAEHNGQAIPICRAAALAAALDDGGHRLASGRLAAGLLPAGASA